MPATLVTLYADCGSYIPVLGCEYSLCCSPLRQKLQISFCKRGEELKLEEKKPPSL